MKAGLHHLREVGYRYADMYPRTSIRKINFVSKVQSETSRLIKFEVYRRTFRMQRYGVYQDAGAVPSWADYITNMPGFDSGPPRDLLLASSPLRSGLGFQCTLRVAT